VCSQVESENISGHVVEHLDKHLTVIVTRLSVVEETVHGGQSARSRVAATSSSSTERCVTDRLRDIEATVRRLNVEGSAVSAAVAGPAAAAAGAADGAAGGADVQSILLSTSEKMTIYEGVITVLNREVEKLSTQVCLTVVHRLSVPHVARGNPPLSFHFPTFYCIFYFSLSYPLHLFSCFSMPSHSTRIVPLRFQVGCRRRRLNLALVFCVDIVLCAFLVNDACLFLSYI